MITVYYIIKFPINITLLYLKNNYAWSFILFFSIFYSYAYRLMFILYIWGRQFQNSPCSISKSRQSVYSIIDLAPPKYPLSCFVEFLKHGNLSHLCKSRLHQNWQQFFMNLFSGKNACITKNMKKEYVIRNVKHFFLH